MDTFQKRFVAILLEIWSDRVEKKTQKINPNLQVSHDIETFNL